MSATPIPVTLITGYLGSGKTTLLNHILTNDEGVRAAVIVNDIGEVNIDANLIQQGGVVDMSDSSLVALSNGCICCSLAGDLTQQLADLADSGAYDHIFIEASGICEPIPIAYNIMAFGEQRGEGETPLALDNIIAVVDAKRMFDEFAGGKALLADDLDEDDIETLLVQQLEFCTTVLLNKADLVTPGQMAELRAIVRSLQKEAVIIESTNADVPLSELIDTGRFDFEKAYSSAAWIDAMEHPEEHEDPEVLEYGIQTFVYREHRPFSRELFENVLNSWPRNVIRCKGTLWFSDDPAMCYLFEQSGFQFGAGQNGRFVASADPETQKQLFEENPEIADHWDPVWGDRETELVFIGRQMDRARVEDKLNAALDPDFDPSDLD